MTEFIYDYQINLPVLLVVLAVLMLIFWRVIDPPWPRDPKGPIR